MSVSHLNEAEIGLIRSLLRQEARRTERKRVAGWTKWGDEYDPTRTDERLAFIETTLEKLI